jgi:hypothetical protein
VWGADSFPAQASHVGPRNQVLSPRALVTPRDREGLRGQGPCQVGTVPLERACESSVLAVGHPRRGWAGHEGE